MKDGFCKVKYVEVKEVKSIDYMNWM